MPLDVARGGICLIWLLLINVGVMFSIVEGTVFLQPRLP